MTTRRAYECNLCHSAIKENKGRGFNFGHDRLDWVAMHSVENHLCDDCVGKLVCSLGDSGIVEDFGHM